MVAHRAGKSLRSMYGNLRPTVARRPQPDALRRFDGAGAHSRRASRDRPPSPEPTSWPRASSGRVSHGTAHLPSSQRYHLTAQGIREAACVPRLCDPPGLRVGPTPCRGSGSTLLIRRMDAVASRVPTCRLDVPRHRRATGPCVEFHRRGRFDATITLHDGRSFGVIRHRASPCGAGRSTTG